MKGKSQQGLRPLGAVGVYILNDKNQLLLMLRTSSHCNGTWSPPGGKIEYGEDFFDSASRETFEECGIEVGKAEVMGVTSDVYPREKRHYISVHLKAVKYRGQAKLREPEKFADLKWFNLDDLPKKLFPANRHFFDQNPFCLCGSGKKFKQCHGK